MTGPTATPGVAQCRTCGDQISEADIRRSATRAGAKSCANVSCSVDRNGPTDPELPFTLERSGHREVRCAVDTARPEELEPEAAAALPRRCSGSPQTGFLEQVRCSKRRAEQQEMDERLAEERRQHGIVPSSHLRRTLASSPGLSPRRARSRPRYSVCEGNAIAVPAC